MPLRLADLHLILPRELQRGLDRFRSAAGEIHRPAAKMFPREIEQLSCKLLGHGRRELAGMDELQLTSLFQHRVSDLAHAVANEIHRRRSGKVEIALPVDIPDIDSLATHRHWIGLAKRTPENGRTKVLMSQGRFRHERIIGFGD